MTINSPGTSLNTDGIHLQNSRDVMIHHTNMSCGKLFLLIQHFFSGIEKEYDISFSLTTNINSKQ